MVNPLDHPLSYRICHYINLISFGVLISTGLLIHSPYPGVPMNLIRNLHFIFMYTLVFNWIVRIYLSFRGKYKDYDAFFLSKHDLKIFWPQIKYYLFIGKHPETGKYNPLQKTAYIAMPIMAVVQAITGLILYRPEKFDTMASFLGGLAAIRGIHYLIMWLFIAIIVIHVYLALTEAFDEFLLMFFGKTDHKKEI
jgi:Ni/Fe-hydrogenase 1 B-type cytochrome subunit